MGTDSATLRKYRETIDQETVLGRLWWYSLSELIIAHDKVRDALAACGLAHLTPQVPKDTDVFKRVSTNAKRTRVPTNKAGVVKNYLIRDVSDEDGVLLRRVVVETKNAAGKRLSYDPAVDVTFDKEQGTIKFERISDLQRVNNDSMLTEITDQILESYDRERGSLNNYAIRELIRKVLTRSGATCVRESGGVYFLLEDRCETMDALEPFFDIFDPEVVNVHSLPVPDNEKQRGMVRRAFEAESAGRLDILMGEIAEVRRDGKPISQERYERLMTEYQDLVTKTATYGKVLEHSLGNVETRLQLASAQVVQLVPMLKQSTRTR